MRWHGVHALVAKAKAGDEAAWRDLCALANPYLLGLAQRLLGHGWPDRSVSDLTQETWLRAWRNLADFRGGQDDDQTGALFRAWLGSILKNTARNDSRFASARRRKGPGPAVRLDAAPPDDSTWHGEAPAARDPSASANLRGEEQRALIRQALEELDDPVDVEILRLHFFESVSLTQIARRLDVTLDRVRQRFHRSLERLRPKLDALR
jgi:RNA polymerase sigma factor (sigma-70 family)